MASGLESPPSPLRDALPSDGSAVVGENRLPELEARYGLPGQYVMRRDL